ncbi:MAG: hypothetical protein JOY57_12040 [Actinobacteria bacterium]|nr:hypothetical protein [Actinomycetota bacterium]
MRRFRVVLVAAAVALSLTPVIARAADAPEPNGGQLVDQCRSSIGDTPELGNRTCRSVESVTNGLAAFCRKQSNPDPEQCARFSGRVVSQAKVDAYEKSWTHRALTLQRALDDGAPLLDEMVVHTHNSFNSSSYPTTVTNQDPNQLYSLSNQLRMDIRFLELDLHWVPSIYGTPATGGYAVTLCHGTGVDVGPTTVHVGCSVDRPFTDGLAEIRMWMNANPDEVVFLYLENQMTGNPTAHALAAAAIKQYLGDLVLTTPPGKPCAPMPLSTSRAAMRAAGKRVLIVGNCGPGAWGTYVYERGPLWDESDEGQGNTYPAFPKCLDLRAKYHYDTHWMRWYEDSTWLTAMTGGGGFSTADEIASMVRCGVQMPGMDQAAPDDGRLAAYVWSWAPDQPAGAGQCAAQGLDARFRATGCGQSLPFACVDTAGTWRVTAATGPWGIGFAACQRQFPGSKFGVPPNGYRNYLLSQARPGPMAGVWLNYHAIGGTWVPNLVPPR